MKLRITLALLAVLLLPMTVQAETPLAGAIAVDQTLQLSDSPFRVTADLTIQSGATLTVEAGVVIYVDPGVNLTVEQGALRLIGAAGQRIVVTSSNVIDTGSPAAGDWGSLTFLDGIDDANTLLQETDLRFGSGLVMQSASPTLQNVAIESMTGAAIDIDLASFPEGGGNSATDCDVNAIRVTAGEMTASGRWALTDIPYLIEGAVAIGAAPTVTGITPSALAPESTTTVTIQGTRLDGAVDVSFDGSGVAGPVTGGNTTSTQVQVTVDSDAPFGSQTFTVDAAAGLTPSGGVTLDIVAGTPVLDSVTPDTASAPAPDTAVTIGGRLFTPGSIVRVGGVDVATTFVSRTELTPTFPASSLEQPGTVNVTIANPDDLNPGQFLVSNGLPFLLRPFGNGADGDLTVDGTTALPNVAAPLVGDAAMGATEITATSVNGATAGDEILIIQMQGTGAGSYEFHRIDSVVGDTATLTRPLDMAYSSSAANRASVIQVPNYENVIVRNGGILTTTPWDGSTGGLLVFRARGQVTVESGGAILVSGDGFRGGARAGGTTSCALAGGQQGESFGGIGLIDNLANDGGGGGGGPDACVDCDVDSPGGGGGYGTAGGAGINPGNPASAGQGGTVYGIAELENELHLGSGGGESHFPGNPGGGGGGGLILFTPTLLVNGGSIAVDGVDGSGCPGGHPSGAGSGGSILIEADTVTTDGALTAVGGTGNGVCECEGETGGSGGDGRIRILTNILQGSASPDPSVKLIDRGDAIITLTPPAPMLLVNSSTDLTVTLDTAAPVGGQVVNLTSSDPAVTVPTSVTVLEGAIQAIFSASSGASPGSAVVSATAPGFTGAMVTVTVAARGVSLFIPPLPLSTTVLATINLDDPAPAGGVTFNIVSTVPLVATVSTATVVIPAGQQAGSFDVIGGAEVGFTFIEVDGTAFGYAFVSQSVFVGEDAVPFNTIVAQPDVELVVSGIGAGTSLNTIVAQPDIELVVSGIGGASGLNTIVASPDVNLVVTGIGVGTSLNTIVAMPDVEVVVPNIGPGTALNTIVAQPKIITIVIPGLDGSDVTINIVIADPKGSTVTIQPE